MHTTYQIKTETADKLRAVAPRLGFTMPAAPEFVAPGIEALHLPESVAAEFDAARLRAKISADSLILRLIKGL